MLRKKYHIAVGVVAGVKKYTVRFKRTEPGDFRCNLDKCAWRGECDHWIFANHKTHTTDICITLPRTSKTVNTRHYYYAYVVKEM